MVAIAGPGWKLAPCLVVMFDEADKRDPTRDDSSDGSIGNAEHQARTSDHNPDGGWVCAGDIDDDDDQLSPGVHLLRQHLVASKDPRVKYLIHEGTIWKAYENRGLAPWTPQVYTGLNAHKSHLHISVWNTPEARNDRSPWWPEEDEMQEADWNRLMEIVANVVDKKLDAKLGTDTKPGENPGPDTVIGRFLARIEQVQGNLAKVIRESRGGDSGEEGG